MVITNGDRYGRSPGTEVDRRGGWRRRVRRGVVGGAAVAELPTSIGPPAPEVAIDVDGAGVRWSGVDLGIVTGRGDVVAGAIAGVGRTVAYRSHRVDGVCELAVDRSRDLARGGVHGQAIRQRRRDHPSRGPTLVRVMELDRVDRLALHHGVRIVRAHAEIHLVGYSRAAAQFG